MTKIQNKNMIKIKFMTKYKTKIIKNFNTNNREIIKKQMI